MTDKILLVENVDIKDNDFVLVKGEEYSFICSEEGITIEDIMDLFRKCQRFNWNGRRKPTKEEYKGYCYICEKRNCGTIEHFPLLKNSYRSSRRYKKVIGIEKKLNRIVKWDKTSLYPQFRDIIDLAYIETRKVRKLINRENFLEKVLN